MTSTQQITQENLKIKPKSHHNIILAPLLDVECGMGNNYSIILPVSEYEWRTMNSYCIILPTNTNKNYGETTKKYGTPNLTYIDDELNLEYAY